MGRLVQKLCHCSCEKSQNKTCLRSKKVKTFRGEKGPWPIPPHRSTLAVYRLLPVIHPPPSSLANLLALHATASWLRLPRIPSTSVWVNSTSFDLNPALQVGAAT